MIKGLYNNAYAMNYLSNKQDIIANNLANANTVGFKKDSIFARKLQDLVNEKDKVPRWDQRSMADQTFTDFTEGSFRLTDNPLDLAINGDGFFEIQTFSGTAYTRNGNFKINSDGMLVTNNNQPVMGKNGPIILIGKDIAIGEDGRVFVDGRYVDKIKVVDFEKPYELAKIGDNLWKEKVPMAVKKDSNARVLQGYLEDSNVNTIEEMVNMIESFREFESNQKSIHAQDETLDTLINSVGRLE